MLMKGCESFDAGTVIFIERQIYQMVCADGNFHQFK